MISHDDSDIVGYMQLEAYAAMQQETGKEHPDLERLAAAHRAISAVGDQEIKEAYVFECKARLLLNLQTRGRL